MTIRLTPLCGLMTIRLTSLMGLTTIRLTSLIGLTAVGVSPLLKAIEAADQFLAVPPCVAQQTRHDPQRYVPPVRTAGNPW